MSTPELNTKNQSNYQKQKYRSSGRVGCQSGMAKVECDSDQTASNPNEVLNIYQRLHDLLDQDASELAGAILYGLKLSNHDKTCEKKKKSFIRRFMTHS
ncbi:MAG: hypothetical protein HQM16_09515 [Deltaproteobacteria bacterium]|nr:hypothetical protein [Deltaproteobacteria bacterium]